MLSLIKKNAAFFIPYFLFLLCGGLAMAVYSKPDIALFINGYHCPIADTFFKYWTNIGLGWLIVPVLFILAFVRRRFMIIAAATFLFTFLINDTIKPIVGAARPTEVFEHMHQAFYAVPGVELYHWNSFPSGHSAIAFALFSLLAFMFHKQALKLLFFAMAFLVAYSRMYLSEHFLIDVYMASLIGVCISTYCYLIGIHLEWSKRFSKIDEPLITLHKKARS